jgi:aminopeptidase YwaD
MTPAPPDWDPAPELEKHLKAVVGDRSPRGAPDRLRAVENYVEAAFREAGLVTRKEEITTGSTSWSNVLGDLPAADKAPLFIIGAHMDSVEGSPGADDNASGLAVLLTLARYLGDRPITGSPVALRLVGFNLEEWGMVGSQDHVEALHRTGRPMAGMIALEMVGYVSGSRKGQRYPLGMGLGRRKTGDFISVVGDRASRDLVEKVAAALGGPKGGLPVETAVIPKAAAMLIGASLSDHSPFWRYGYKAVMVGDTAFYRNPNYHLPGDTLDTLSIPFMAQVTRGLASFLDGLRSNPA